MSRIVVGYDGSACSSDALRWGLTEAAARGRSVLVVSVVESRHVASMWTASVSTPPPTEDLDRARVAAEEAVGKVAADLGVTVPFEVSVRVGHAGPTLVGAAAEGDWLVVGSHGYSALGRLLLGGVSTYAVHHAGCPVVVIRPADHSAAE